MWCQVAIGQHGVCVVTESGELKCWGACGFNMCNTDSTSHIGDDASEMGANLAAIDLGKGRRAVGVCVGFEHTCVLLDDGSVKCLGNNCLLYTSPSPRD